MSQSDPLSPQVCTTSVLFICDGMAVRLCADRKRLPRAELNGGHFADFYSGKQRLGTYELQSLEVEGEL